MNIKKIFLFLTLIVVSLSSLNAVTSLTSCGKNSGWVNGETYTLDFNEIPLNYPNSYCFQFPVTVNNITITGTSDINVKKDMGTFFYSDGYINSRNNTYEHINLYSTDGKSISSFINKRYQTTAGGAFSANELYSYLDDISLNLKVTRFIDLNMVGGSSFKSVGFSNSEFNNLYLPNLDYFVYSRSNMGQYDSAGFNNNIIQNSLIYSNINIRSNYDRFSTNSVSFSNSVIYSTGDNADLSIFLASPWTYDNSIIVGNTVIDSDNNNIGDVDLPYITNQKIVLQFRDYNFFTSLAEGLDVYDTFADNNLINVFPNNEVLEDSFIGSYYTNSNGQPSDFLGTLIIEKQNNFIINGGIDCSAFSSEYCFIQDSVTYSAVTSNKFRGLINLGGGIIEYMNISKVSPSNSNIFSNIQDTYSTGLIIQNNELSKTDDRADDNENELINLKANDLNINNNNLQVYYTGIQSYEFLSIESTTPNNNIVTLNNFNQDLVSVKVDQQIFNSFADTTFYNNYLGQNIVVSNSLKSNLNVNPLSSVEFNNQIYYFQIGNYYADNVGCVDVDGNGICDSPYTSGAIVDNFPLASYPYNFLAHLGDAQSVVTISQFNISLNIIENQTFVLNNLATDTISLGFNHNSLFSDLTCSYILDGASILDFPNVENTIEHNIDVSSWTEKSYSYRVECANEFIFQQSNEILFNVELFIDNGNGGTGGTGNETVITDSLNLNLFSGDVDETSDSLQSVLNVVQSPMGFLLMIGLVFIGISIIGLMFAVARSMVK